MPFIHHLKTDSFTINYGNPGHKLWVIIPRLTLLEVFHNL